MGWLRRFFLVLVLLFGGFLLIQVDFSNKTVEGCPFCNPSVLESQKVLGGSCASIVIPYKPITPGHVLIVPNRHVDRFEFLTGEEIEEMGELVKRMEPLFRPLYDSSEYLLLQKNGRGVGQTVPHVHLHMIPKPDPMSQFIFTIRFFVKPRLKPLSNEELRVESSELRNAFSDFGDGNKKGVDQQEGEG